MPLTCPTRAELDSFQAGDLEERALAAVSSHVETCSNCQKQLETIIGDSEDTVLHALLVEPEPSPFAAEAGCRVAVERVANIAAVISGAAEFAPTIDSPPRAEFAGEDLPLDSIREYKLLAKLGEGGMGAVYKALHTRLDKVVALKVLPQGRMRDAGSVARFQREMKAVGRLDHPNIVRAMDAGEEDGTHFLVMEYVEGADLSQLAKSVRVVPVADACELVRQAAIGLQEAHEHGMVHRDIKPSNLILAKPARKKSPPTLKILDLGLALLGEALSADQGLTSTGQMMGTIDYMAPEQGSDTHRVDIRADIYSLGATLYRLLTGTAPFAGEKFDTPVKKILALATKEPATVQTLRADVPPALAAIVHKMLAKDPSERYTTPEEVAEALAPFCPGTNLAALLEKGTRARPANETSESPTHSQRSTPSAETAPTIDPRSVKIFSKPTGQNALAPAASRRKIPRIVAVAAACGGLALAVLLGVVFYLETLKGTIRVEINDPAIKVALDENSATFQGVDKKHSIKVQAGPHGLTVTRGDLKFTTDKFEIRKGETLRLSVRYLVGRVHVVDVANGKSLGNSSWHGWPKDAPAPAIAPFDAQQARKHQEEWAEYLGVPVEYENSIGMKFALIPPGEFLAGSTSDEVKTILDRYQSRFQRGRAVIESESPQHKTVLTKPFYLGVHEVTQRDFEKVTLVNPSEFSPRGARADKVKGLDSTRHPVESVAWNEAAEFCEKLSQREKFTPYYVRAGDTVKLQGGSGYRLPSEAQWEFSCASGTSSRFWSGDSDASLYASGWVNKNSGARTHTIGELTGNPFGLFDVTGNVSEWCQDWWHQEGYRQISSDQTVDPAGPLSGDERVVRGGFFNVLYPDSCRSRARGVSKPANRSANIGFRAALTVDAVKTAMVERKAATATAAWQGWPKDAPAPAIAPFDAAQARKHQEAWAEYLGVPAMKEVAIGDGVKLVLVLVPPGEFLMGSAAEEQAKFLAEAEEEWAKKYLIPSEGPQHRVRITRPFYVGKFEVTQAQWRAVTGADPSKVRDDSTYPVRAVSWVDVQLFLAKLNQSASAKKLTFSLPTEGQWEYACRAGTTQAHFSAESMYDLRDYGWFNVNSGSKVHPVGQLRANAFGLHDMHGNVWEWCADWFAADYYAKSPVDDPAGPSAGMERVGRGGCWDNRAGICRSALRGHEGPDDRHGYLGFRVTASVALGTGSEFALEFTKPSRVRVPGLPLDPTKPFTIEAYATVQKDSPGGYIGAFFNQLSLRLTEDQWSFGATLERITESEPVAHGARQHVAGVYNGRELLLFRNGKRVGRRARSEGLWKGALEGDFVVGFNLNGILDELRVSQVARYDQDFNPDLRLATDPQTLAFYHFDEGEGTVLKDSSGHGLDGDIAGAKWVRVEGTADAAKPPIAQKAVPATAIAPFDENQAKKYQRDWAKHLGVPVEFENSLRMKFVLIPPGEFTMGSTPEQIEMALKDAGENKNLQDSARSEGPQHKVILTQPMYLGVHEVTQGNYEKVMGNNPAYFAKDGRERDTVAKVFGMDTTVHPVEGLRWEEAVDFCTKLSELEKLTSFDHSSGDSATKAARTGYRLPTEALWEFACRAGTTTKYSFGDKDEDLPQAGWFRGNADWRTHKVGDRKANPLGLYDMHGNVWEWMQDGFEPAYYGQFADKPAQDPSGPSPPGANRMLRGGAWNLVAPMCGSSRRFASGTNVNYYDYGFRVALPVDAVKKALAEKKAGLPAAANAGWHGWPKEAPKPAIAPFSAEQAKTHQEEWAGYLNVPVEHENSLRMKFVLIPPGEFTMGSTAAEIEEALKAPNSNEWAKDFVRGESPKHKVILTQPIYVGIHEVTQKQFELVTGENPSHFSPKGAGKNDFGGMDRTNCPVESIRWIDAAEFCIKLSLQEKLRPFYLPSGELVEPTEGTAYRLPTEAQWEFACRAGTLTKYWTGDKDEDLPQAAWFKQNAAGLPHPVGTLKPNPFGLYDVHGNIWECVHDGWEPGYFGQFKEKPAVDPSGAAFPVTARMLRGGNWSFGASDCRSSGRLGNEPAPAYRSTGIGFRIALPVTAVQQVIKEGAANPR